MTAAKTLLIVYHSHTGGTRQMVDAACAGAASADSGVAVRLLHAPQAQAADVLAADGYLFATHYAALDQINGRPYATLVCAGSDGTNAARQIARIATGWRLRPVADPLIVCTHAQTPEAILAPKQIASADLERCRALGEAMAAGLGMGVF
jgi:hypothetical protein